MENKKELIKKLSFEIKNAKKYINKKLRLIAEKAPQRKWLDERDLAAYWKLISYDLTEKHLEGLDLFEKYILKFKIRD